MIHLFLRIRLMQCLAARNRTCSCPIRKVLLQQAKTTLNRKYAGDDNFMSTKVAINGFGRMSKLSCVYA